MKKKYLPPVMRIFTFDTSTTILTVSGFDGYLETPQDIPILDDEIGNSGNVG